MKPFGLAFRSVSRNPLRSLGLCIGLASAMFAVIQMDGIASWTEITATASLNAAIGDSDIWVVPKDGVSLGKNPPAIEPNGSVTSSVAESFIAGCACRCAQVLVGRTQLSDRTLLIMGDSRLSGRQAVASTGVTDTQVAAIARGAGARLDVERPTNGLPPAAELRLSMTIARSLLGARSGVSWLLCREAGLARLAATAQRLHLLVTDDPGFRPSQDDAGAVVLLSKKLSRFDPFTFRTKYSSLMLHNTLTTAFGALSRAAFVVGLFFCISSFVYQVRERRAEMGCYASIGLSGEVVSLFLYEAVMVCSLSFLVGSTLAAAALWPVLPPGLRLAALTEAVLLSSAYLPVVVVLATLVPAQTVVGAPPLDLVRG